MALRTKRRRSRVVAGLVAICLLLGMVPVYGAETALSPGADFAFQLDIEQTPPVVTVSGILADNPAYRLVGMQVLYCGPLTGNVDEAQRLAQYETAKAALGGSAAGVDFSDTLFYYDQQLTDAAGNYAFTFTQDGEDGLYAVRLFTENSQSLGYYFYNFFDPADIAQTVLRLDTATPEEMVQIIADNSFKLNMDLAGYDTLDEAGKREVCRIAAVNREALGGTFGGLNGFLAVFGEAKILHQLNTAADADTFMAQATANESLFGLAQEAAYETYVGLSEETQTLIGDALAAMQFDLAADVAAAFRETTVLLGIHKVVYSNEVGDILRQNSAWLTAEFEFDFTDYNADEDLAEAVNKELAGHLYGDIAKLRSAFVAAMDDTEEDNQGGQRPGSNTGGGGSSGSRPSGPTISTGGQPTQTATPAPTASVRFSDMEDAAWAIEAVDHLAGLGIVNGRTDGLYEPNATITREEFTKLLVVAFDLMKPGARCKFTDVAREDWSYDYIASAVRAGIVSGKSETLFGVGENITRQEMAVMIGRTADRLGLVLPPQAEAVTFADDAEIAEYAKETVSKMQVAGIVSGVGDNRFDPLGTATRAQAAVIIDKLYRIAN